MKMLIRKLGRWIGLLILVLIFIPLMFGLGVIEFITKFCGGCDKKNKCKYYNEDSHTCNVDGGVNPVDGSIYCGKWNGI